MARKSATLRLSQTQALLDDYESAGLNSDRSCRFLRDMAQRLSIGKGLSTGQRKYLDSLIDQGVPKPKNEARVKEILAAVDVDGMQEVKPTLQDFAFKVGKGWSLSEKQEKFLANLLAKAETLTVDGRFRPSPETVKDLEVAVSICDKKNGWYWQHRPGTAKAYDKARAWIEWNTRREVIEDVKALGKESTLFALTLGEEPIIDQWVCNKLLAAVKNQINELHNPKHVIGDMRWARNPGGTKKLALVSGAPQVVRGELVYPCLVEGGIIEVPTGNLLKRRG
jgi:hypothetical protein